MLLRGWIEVAARGGKPGTFALRVGVDMHSVLPWRKILEVQFDRDPVATLVFSDGGRPNALPLSIGYIHRHRLIRGISSCSYEYRSENDSKDGFNHKISFS